MPALRIFVWCVVVGVLCVWAMAGMNARPTGICMVCGGGCVVCLGNGGHECPPYGYLYGVWWWVCCVFEQWRA
ncbi:MAG: hypothetical protein RBR82_06155 [Pseudomonas sp.]|nr:hypothetical protein [Pseudomonas sp.]